MAQIINPHRQDPLWQRVADKFRVSDVYKDGVTMTDEEGIVDLSMLSAMQRDIDYIMEQIGIGRYLQASQSGEYILTSDGQRIELI